MKTKFILFSLRAICCCCNKPALKQPALLGGKPLPEGYASPDGYALSADGYIYVSINQRASDWKYPAKIARISPDDVIEDFFILPVNEKTGKASPLGLTFAANGKSNIDLNSGPHTADDLQTISVISLSTKK